MEHIDYSCPYCGAQIELNPADTEWYCTYCDSRIIPEGDVLQKIRYERKKSGRRAGHEERNARWDIPRQDGFYDMPSRTESRSPAASVSGKSRLLALLFAVFLGPIGVHRFYCGKIGTGILYVFTGGLFGIGYIVDIILIACGAFKDAEGYPLLNWDV